MKMLRGAVAAQKDRCRMPGGRPDAFSGERVDLDTDDRGECFGFLGGDEAAQLGDGLRWAKASKRCARRALRICVMSAAACKAMTCRISDDQGDVPGLELKCVVPIAAHLGCLRSRLGSQRPAEDVGFAEGTSEERRPAGRSPSPAGSRDGIAVIEKVGHACCDLAP